MKLLSSMQDYSNYFLKCAKAKKKKKKKKNIV